MDSSVSPTHGEQENSVWNGHYACTCYHPLFVFNQFGDLERCALRAGNVHSADGWDDVLKPVVARYQGKVSRIYFRADAAFAMPEARSSGRDCRAERSPPTRCGSSSCARLQPRQFPAHAGDARADQGLVADDLEGRRERWWATAAMLSPRWPRSGKCSREILRLIAELRPQPPPALA